MPPLGRGAGGPDSAAAIAKQEMADAFSDQVHRNFCDSVMEHTLNKWIVGQTTGWYVRNTNPSGAQFRTDLVFDVASNYSLAVDTAAVVLGARVDGGCRWGGLAFLVWRFPLWHLRILLRSGPRVQLWTVAGGCRCRLPQ